MREILFRGKSTEEDKDVWLKKGDWILGDLIHYKDKRFILPSDSMVFMSGGMEEHWIEVDPKTVGQFTGLLDKNGERIFDKN